MDAYIKNSIDGRYQAFTTCYEINDANIQKKIDALFQKINAFGETCKDVMDFETKFATSPLNTEYNNLFTEIATTCKAIIPDVPKEEGKSNKRAVLDEVASNAKYAVREGTLPIRRVIREKVDQKLRDTPIGRMEQLKDQATIFKRIFK